MLKTENKYLHFINIDNLTNLKNLKYLTYNNLFYILGRRLNYLVMLQFMLKIEYYLAI